MVPLVPREELLDLLSLRTLALVVQHVHELHVDDAAEALRRPCGPLAAL